MCVYRYVYVYIYFLYVHIYIYVYIYMYEHLMSQQLSSVRDTKVNVCSSVSVEHRANVQQNYGVNMWKSAENISVHENFSLLQLC